MAPWRNPEMLCGATNFWHKEVRRLKGLEEGATMGSQICGCVGVEGQTMMYECILMWHERWPQQRNFRMLLGRRDGKVEIVWFQSFHTSAWFIWYWFKHVQTEIGFWKVLGCKCCMLFHLCRFRSKSSTVESSGWWSQGVGWKLVHQSAVNVVLWDCSSCKGYLSVLSVQ